MPHDITNVKKEYEDKLASTGQNNQSRVVTMKYNVTDIEFDFDDDNDGELSLTFEEEIALET